MVLRSINLVVIPPLVSTPKESGVTSRRSTSLTSPPKTPPWMAAPIATTSSGLMDLSSSALPNTSLATSWTWGMRVDPPTMTTSSTLEPSSLASASAWRQGPASRSNKLDANCSNFARLMDCCKCSGPRSGVAVMNGKFTEVSDMVESSCLAFSAASFNLCRAIGS